MLNARVAGHNELDFENKNNILFYSINSLLKFIKNIFFSCSAIFHSGFYIINFNNGSFILLLIFIIYTEYIMQIILTVVT